MGAGDLGGAEIAIGYVTGGCAVRFYGKTKIFGIFGDPVEYAMSPVIHNAGYESEGLNCVYLPFNIKKGDIEAAIFSMRALGFTGASVTMPHKESVMPFLDEISGEAELIGSINVVYNNGSKLIGYNTDGDGFLRGLTECTGFNCEDKTILIFGAGGASKAIALTAALKKARKLYIVNRSPNKASDIAGMLNRKTNCICCGLGLDEKKYNEILPGVDLIINTTSQGMYGNESTIHKTIDWESIPKSAIVSDIVYRPLETPFLAAASASGLKTVTGEHMVLYQAALAYELWLDRKAPIDVMRNALNEALSIRRERQ